VEDSGSEASGTGGARGDMRTIKDKRGNGASGNKSVDFYYWEGYFN